MLVFSGLETEDFTCRSPGELEVVRNDILKPLARDGLPLYPYAHDDGSTGKLRNLASLTDATLTGGSTLSGAAKQRNDFQHAGQLIPGQRLFRAAPAWSNLLYSLHADNPSFEGGTTGQWSKTHAPVTLSVNSGWAFHGTKSLFVSTPTAGSWEGIYLDVSGVCAAGSQYSAIALVRNGSVAQRLSLYFYGNVSGSSSTGQDFGSNQERLMSTTWTFNAGDTTRRLYCACRPDMGYGHPANSSFYLDAVMVVSGSTIPMFTEAENTACHATFPTPISPGESFSFVVFVWSPWVGDDSSSHVIFRMIVDANNFISISKSGGNQVSVGFIAGGVARAATLAVNAANWPAGSFHCIAGSIASDGVCRGALDGTALTASAAGVREGSLPSTMAIGYDPWTALYRFNGLILGPFIYRGVAWDSATCQRMSRLKAPPPRNLVVRAA